MMKMGFSVEGSTDRALLRGLQIRWCKDAELIEGRFRGTSGLSQKREIPKICTELDYKGVDLIVFLRDSNDEDWRTVLKEVQLRCLNRHKHLAVFGVCDRNVECWICADTDWIAAQTKKQASDFRITDPKRIFEHVMGITAFDRKEEEITQLVIKAPLRNWLRNRSFKAFYNQLWQKSTERGCSIENLMEKPKSS